MTAASEQNPTKRHVLIVGAGPAGITCGLEILRRRPDLFDVEIIETSNDIGGISKTVNVHGNRMDIGGHRFFSKNTDIMKWWKDILPIQGAPAYDDAALGRARPLEPGGPDPATDDEVMLQRHRVSRIFYDNSFFDYPLNLNMKMLKTMGFGRTLSVGFSYIASAIHKLPETSLENFYINRFGRKLYSMFFEGYTEKLWGRHPNVISADWGSQRVKGLSIRAVVKDMFSKKPSNDNQSDTETSLIKRFLYPKYGPGQLWETAAKRYCELGGKLSCATTAEHFNFDDSGKITSVDCLDGKSGKRSIPCDILVSSMPLNDLGQACGQVMPMTVQDVAQGLPFRDFVTVGLLVDGLRIHNETDMPTLGNIVPDDWIYVQDDKVKVGRLQVFNNWSPYMVDDVDNTVWVGLEYFCTEGDSFWNMPEDECIEQAHRELVRIGVLDEDAPILLSHRERVKKAYPAYFDTYADIDILRDWLKAVPNLYCVGRNGQHRYNNMDHSMLTAMYAAEAICEGTKTQDDIWSVNTETSYQEESDKLS